LRYFKNNFAYFIKKVIYKKNNNFYFVILYAMGFLNNVFYSFLIITLSLSTVRR